jgi:hypothetical protein
LFFNVFQICDIDFLLKCRDFLINWRVDFHPDPDNLFDNAAPFGKVRIETKLEDSPMSRITRGIFALVALLAAVAVFARLPLPSPILEIVALGVLGVVLVAVEWPRWHHARWPNKLGEL